jgi:molecular chaperone DnaK (HSP70)
MTSAIAIDFGTSRTKVAYWNPDWHRPDLISFHGNVPYVSSLFYLFRDSERMLWGHEAEEMLKEDPAGVVDVLKWSLPERYVYVNRRKMSP